MYTKHRVILILLSILMGIICCLLELRITSIASDVISVVSISSALYLAAYAGIQASTELKERLKKPDEKLTHRSQRYVLNSYFKVALVLNVVTIVSVCMSVMVSERSAQFDLISKSYRIKQLIDWITTRPLQAPTPPFIWLIVNVMLNFVSITLFIANLIQMCYIGKFVVNRIAFDK